MSTTFNCPDWPRCNDGIRCADGVVSHDCPALPKAASRAMTAALAAIDAATDPNTPRNRKLRVAHLLRRRSARRAKVNRFAIDGGYWPLMVWLREEAPRGFLSLDEACRWFRREIDRIRRLKAMGHWSFRDNAHRLPGLKDRLIVCRYFAMYGADIWAHELVEGANLELEGAL